MQDISVQCEKYLRRKSVLCKQTHKGLTHVMPDTTSSTRAIKAYVMKNTALMAYRYIFCTHTNLYKCTMVIMVLVNIECSTWHMIVHTVVPLYLKTCHGF